MAIISSRRKPAPIRPVPGLRYLASDTGHTLWMSITGSSSIRRLKFEARAGIRAHTEWDKLPLERRLERDEERELREAFDGGAPPQPDHRGPSQPPTARSFGDRGHRPCEVPQPETAGTNRDGRAGRACDSGDALTGTVDTSALSCLIPGKRPQPEPLHARGYWWPNSSTTRHPHLGWFLIAVGSRAGLVSREYF